MQVHFYNNPNNSCPTCTNDPNFEGQLGCWDNFESTRCRMGNRCDNEFFFCLRPLMTPHPGNTAQAFQETVYVRSVEERTELLQCLRPPGALRSGINTNGRGIDYHMTFLGLPNPLQFTVNASQWEVSIQLSQYTTEYSLSIFRAFNCILMLLTEI